jgi:hypothetical protein
MQYNSEANLSEGRQGLEGTFQLGTNTIQKRWLASFGLFFVLYFSLRCCLIRKGYPYSFGLNADELSKAN